MKTKDIENIYKPNSQEKKILDSVYKDIDKMISARNKSYVQFNDKTLQEFLDDCEKRVQGYVPSKESQGKEDWQSNSFNQSTRNKLKAIVAAVALTPPEVRLKAITPNGFPDTKRANVMKALIDYSRNKTNQETESFWDAWTVASLGTVVDYDGYIKAKMKEKFLTSYNIETGDLEWEEKEVTVADECITVQVPLDEFYIADFYISDVQKQPYIAWIRYMDKENAEFEFGEYKNWKYVVSASNAHDSDILSSQDWFSRCQASSSDYEVIKYYNKFTDSYDIIVNGVLLLDSPLLWGRKKKLYPFAKTIYEPFANKDFFYGNSLPNANMNTQDVINSLYNMLLDKTYRSLTPPLLVGMANKDLLDLENENVGLDNTIYVQDINQVNYMKVPPVSAPELEMLNIASRGMDLGTVDINQQGVAGRGVTAREVVIADERARQMKGMFFMFLSDLWIQKTRLRIYNILLNYTLPIVEKTIGKKNVEIYKTFLLPNQLLSNGRKGTLAIQFVGENNNITPEELSRQEEAARNHGENFEKIVLNSHALDDLDYEFEIVTNSLYQKDLARNQAMFSEKVQQVMALFPEIFQANKQIFFDDLMKLYDDNPDRYITGEVLQPQNQPNQPVQPNQLNQPNQSSQLLKKPLTETQKTQMPPIPGLPNVTKTPYNL